MSETPFDPTSQAKTLVELSRRRTQAQPGRRSYTFLLEGEREEVHLSYGELGRQARSVAARAHLKGDLGVDVPEVSIFEGSTVAALACLLAPEEEAETYEGRRNRGERRRAARKGRRATAEVS